MYRDLVGIKPSLILLNINYKSISTVDCWGSYENYEQNIIGIYIYKKHDYRRSIIVYIKKILSWKSIIVYIKYFV